MNLAKLSSLLVFCNLENTNLKEPPYQFCFIPLKFQIIVTAYEEDDRINRPWRNANATVCFIFNRRPEFMGPLEIRLNLPDMASSELRDLSARDLDAHQVLNLSFSIGETIKNEPVREKNNDLGSDKVRHKPACTSTENG